MKKKLINFCKKIIILDLILGLFSAVFFIFINPKLYFNSFPVIFVIFTTISIISHYILLKSFEERPKRFFGDFMITTMIKLLGYSVFIGIFLYSNKAIAKPFAIAFLSFYIIYTVFDVKYILSDTSENKIKNND